MLTIEKIILSNLLENENYMRKVLPFLKREYFSSMSEKVLYDHINNFIDKYNTCPTIDAIEISIQKDKAVSEGVYSEISELLPSLKTDAKNEEWLINETEKFCKEKAVYNAILNSISIIDGKDKNLSPDAIPSILQEALSVCFDTSVGHDYFDNADQRFEFYNKKEDRVPFDLEMFNKITNGGLPNKTLNVILAGTNVGKSLFMCHVAAKCLSEGKNVLYITLEMAEERIAERIDANLLDIPINQLKDIPKNMFTNRVKKLMEKTHGKLIVKEYPTASAHSNHFRSLLNELALKRNFTPEIIFIDYLNICASVRYKPSSGANSYTVIKGIAEELRGLAVEFNVPIMTATQTNRSGFANSDVELTDTSESFGLPATADLMFALISTEELEKMNQLMVKQLKNRYNDPSQNKRFVIGVDRAKMKLYDLEQSAQENLYDTGQEQVMIKPRNKGDFSSIKL